MRQNRYNTCSTLRYFTWLLLVGFLTDLSVAAVSPATVKPIFKPDPALEEAILTENWEKVIRLLPEEMEPNLPAPFRLVKAHACLATNRNNKSLCLFLSASSEVELYDWESWVETFVANHPGNPIAYYFQGDAMARMGKWKGAIAAYDVAVAAARKNRHALAFNARGVAHTHDNELGKARVDFAKAIKYSNGKLADAYANIGVLRIQKKDGARTAEKVFDRALKISPAFALALHGRGCVRQVLGEMSKAQEDLMKAEKNVSCAGWGALMSRNRLRIVAYWRGMTESELLAKINSGEEAGTTFDSNIRNVTNDWARFERWHGKPGGQFMLNRFNENYGNLTPTQQETFFRQRIAPSLRSNNSLLRDYDSGLTNIHNTNKYLAPVAGNGLKMSGAITAGIGATHGNIPTIAAGVGQHYAGGKFDIWGQHNLKSANSQRDLTTRHFGNSLKGGVDTSLTHIPWDSGEWPFRGYYGLVFQVDMTELSLGQTDTSSSDKPVAEVLK